MLVPKKNRLEVYKYLFRGAQRSLLGLVSRRVSSAARGQGLGFWGLPL